MGLLTQIESLPWVFGALLMVAVFVTFTVAGIILVRKNINPKSLKAHHDVAGFVFTNLGVLYAVLLGFTVVNVQQRFDRIKETTLIEASYLAELYRDAGVFAEKDKERIQNSLVRYTKSVIENEWPVMANGHEDTNTIAALKDVWNAYYEIDPTTKKQDMWYSVSINKLNLFLNTRLTRILGSKESLGTEMWTFLILGGLSIITFIWFFTIESLTSHLLMASILAATTAFLLFLIYSLDTAFAGQISIPPDPMERVLHSFEIT